MWSGRQHAACRFGGCANSSRFPKQHCMPGGAAFAVGAVNCDVVDTRCRDQAAIERSGRLESISQSRDGRLDSWCWK